MPVFRRHKNGGDAAEFLEDELEPQKLRFLYRNVTGAPKVRTVTFLSRVLLRRKLLCRLLKQEGRFYLGLSR